MADIKAAVTQSLAMVGDLVDPARLQAGRALDRPYRAVDLVALMRREGREQPTDGGARTRLRRRQAAAPHAHHLRLGPLSCGGC